MGPVPRVGHDLPDGGGCAVSLVAPELLAGLRARARPVEPALELGVGVAMGVGVVALRVILH